MKIKTLLFLSIAMGLTASFFFFFLPRQKPNEAVSIREESDKPKEAVKKSASYLKARAQYEYDMLKNPHTGKIPEGIYQKEMAFAQTLPERNRNIQQNSSGFREAALNNYIPAGPNNIGGRTRAVRYDLRYNGTTNRVIISGSVSGGILRSADGGDTWKLVTPDGDYHNLTALVQDPRPGFQDTWYAGTGEALGNTATAIGAPFIGYGLWKSTDNGVTWTKLSSTIQNNNFYAFDHRFDFVYNMDINPLNGDLYVSCWALLLKSSDGGNSFRAVFQTIGFGNSATGQSHVVVSNTGRVYLAVNGAADLGKRGVWYSATGEPNTFNRIAGGSTLGVDSVAGWRGNSYKVASTSSSGTIYEAKRILITLAPSNNNIAYLYYENGLSSDPPDLKPEADFFRLDISGNFFTWINRSANMPDFPGQNLSGSDPLTLQNGYDMEVTVKPDNPNIVFIGGTNLYRSTDAFATTSNTTWIAGYSPNFTYSSYGNTADIWTQSSHPDIHALVFRPGNSNQAICANDGGIQETTNILAANVNWRMLPNYQTLQCFNVAIDPGVGRYNFASGSMDNGVRFRDKTGVLGTAPADSNNHARLFSADGAYVGITLDNSGTQYLFESIQFGVLYRARLTSPFRGGTAITPSGLTTSSEAEADRDRFGEFVTNLRLEADNTNTLYYVNFNRLFVTNNASNVTSSTWTELAAVSAAVNPANPTSGRDVSIRGIGFSRGPYTTNHALYFGTTNGRIFRIDNPHNATPATVPVNITPAGLTGCVQDIAVNPNNDEEVMAVVSNYGVVGIWWTKNAKATIPTWKNAEGNIPLPSFRSAAIIVKKDAANQPVTEYYVGTSIGLYSTVNLATVLDANQQPVWLREGGDVLRYALVTSLAYRPADNVLLVGTHGNGMFYTNVGTPNFTPNVSTGITPITNDRNFIRNIYPTLSRGNAVQYQTGNMPGIRKLLVQVINPKGQEVFRAENSYQNGSVPMQQLSSGVYILAITSTDNRYRHVQKIVRH